MKRSFKVTIDVPPDATIRDCQNYILEAVQTWRGQTRPPGSLSENDPGDPMFELNADTITVTRIRP